MVLFPDAFAQRDLLPFDSVHLRSALDLEFLGDSAVSPRQRPAHDRLLPRRTAVAVHRLRAISFSAFAPLGRNGGTSRGVRRWANARKRRPVVSDGRCATSFPLDARRSLAVRNAGNDAIHDIS